MQVFFFQKEFQIQPLQPGEQIPINEPQIITGHILPKIRELDALPFALAAPFPLHPATEDLAAHQFQALKLRQQLGR